MILDSVVHVVERMRRACFDEVRLVSDDQPDRLRVEEHTFGPPAVWLHPDGTNMAWVIVDVGERDWSRLAYQFGHELDHVTANSWRPNAKPAAPCQWFEEAMVEAFSLRGLALLADDWSRSPPFPDDSGFGAAVAVYRQTSSKNTASWRTSRAIRRTLPHGSRRIAPPLKLSRILGRSPRRRR
jgi:hypothetical protein